MSRARVLRALVWGAAAVIVVGVGLFAGARARGDVQCAPGFVASGARCLVPGGTCPAPLVSTNGGCDAPDVRVLVPAAKLLIGPSDWEAEGRVAPRTIETGAFYLDAFEVTAAKWSAANAGVGSDGARAANGMTRAEAAAFCATRGGRLPTEDEWIAAASDTPDVVSRYPWGETGAVCRRAAWGLDDGPCARGAAGPDTVGAHPAGDTKLGAHDMAGNVAEWVDTPGEGGVARGGSWKSALATELRVWARLELPADARDPRVGARCAYDAPAAK